MRASLIALVASALLGSAVAGRHEKRHAHQHLHEKKDYPVAPPAVETPPVETPATPANDTDENCGCTTIWSTWYGEATLAPPPPSEKPSENPVTEKEQHKEKPKPKPKAPSFHAPVPKLGGGSKWAITYSAYKGASASSSSCKSQGEVESDIAKIAGMGFSTVRIYATDCHHLDFVGGAAKKHGMKMILGIFIGDGGINDKAYGQLSDITSYFKGDYSMVEMLLVGNEALFNHRTDAGSLAKFVEHSRDEVRKDGFNGPVSTAETVKDLVDNADTLCPAVDVLAANIHPYFNGHVQPSGSGKFVDDQMDILSKLCGGTKDYYNSECGWPTQGPDYFEAHPGKPEQIEAIASISKAKNVGKTVFFSYENDGWKDNGDGSVEPFWGCGAEFGN